MSEHTLFICKSCHIASTEEHNPASPEGSQLLIQLLALKQNQSKPSELEIQPVNCLWACGHPCVVAFSADEKFTYLLMDLPLSDCAAALLQLSQLYRDSEDGTIPWSKFPEPLKAGAVARIPTMPSS